MTLSMATLLHNLWMHMRSREGFRRSKQHRFGPRRAAPAIFALVFSALSTLAQAQPDRRILPEQAEDVARRAHPGDILSDNLVQEDGNRWVYLIVIRDANGVDHEERIDALSGLPVEAENREPA